ncbi:putative LysE/RhtB family amino acid efflux pump [Lachnospiraceae bacterium TWA4]|nr:putative LysE/RhtB family amino acid efflux pump [Lachnospiraceae bacterium TWA4]
MVGDVWNFFFIGITNPAAILTFLFAFTYFGINQISSAADGIAIVIGVFLGTFIWWSILSFGTDVVAKKSAIKKFSKLNRVFGVILVLFGVVVLGKGVLG